MFIYIIRLNFIFLILIIVLSNSYKYSTPRSKDWPSEKELTEFKLSLKGKIKLRDEIKFNPYQIESMNTKNPGPEVVVEVIETEDVIKTVQFARKHNIRIFVLSTGHHQDLSGLEINSIYVDMSKMRNISINKEDKTITVETGCPWELITDKVKKESKGKLIIATGRSPTVGPYGWSVGGGIGVGTRLMGFGADNIVSVKIVLADSSVVTASENENQDLYRALRGSGGGPWGIALNLTLRLHDNPGDVYMFKGNYECNYEIAKRFSSFTVKINNEISSNFYIRNKKGICEIDIIIYCWKDCNKNIFDEFYEGCLKKDSILCTIQKKNWFDAAITKLGEHKKLPSRYSYAGAVKSNDLDEASQEMIKFVKSVFDSECNETNIGGKAQFYDPDQSLTTISPEFRKALMQLTCRVNVNSTDSYSDKLKRINLIDDFGENVIKKFSPFVYWNDAQHNFPKNDWRERFWGGMDSYNKLLEVKKKYDPENFFTCYNCVGYEESEFDPETSVFPRKESSNLKINKIR